MHLVNETLIDWCINFTIPHRQPTITITLKKTPSIMVR